MSLLKVSDGWKLRLIVCVEAELASTRNVLAGIIQLGTLLQKLLLQRPSTP